MALTMVGEQVLYLGNGVVAAALLADDHGRCEDDVEEAITRHSDNVDVDDGLEVVVTSQVGV